MTSSTSALLPTASVADTMVFEAATSASPQDAAGPGANMWAGTPYVHLMVPVHFRQSRVHEIIAPIMAVVIAIFIAVMFARLKAAQ